MIEDILVERLCQRNGWTHVEDYDNARTDVKWFLSQPEIRLQDAVPQGYGVLTDEEMKLAARESYIISAYLGRGCEQPAYDMTALLLCKFKAAGYSNAKCPLKPQPVVLIPSEHDYDCSDCDSDNCRGCGESAFEYGWKEGVQAQHDKDKEWAD